MSTTNLQPGLYLSFELQTDNQWQITATDSLFDMDMAFYELAKNEVAAHAKNKSGRFDLDDRTWSYIADPTASGYTIVFLDHCGRAFVQ
ncbi:hypothetical protein [Paenibacillus terrigena]|uniref:hypothetical protein n=1 Tax=Paenibacillus terrigena TaxID=369333 RepID=UPI0028D38FFC|nr:hypothetical protein [Paenibacillus terrigena]